MCIIFGDNYGIPQLIKHIPTNKIKAIVAASARPQYHELANKIADTLCIPLLIQPAKNSLEYSVFINQLRKMNPEFIIVQGYSMLLDQEILDIAKVAAVNIHGALLPQYRGPNPIQWALVNNETETGVTMHYMTEDFDAGDIIAQNKIPIYIEDTWLEILDRITESTDNLLKEELPKLFSQTNARIYQDIDNARKWPRRTPDDGRIDLSKSVLSIYNLIRALVKPHPGAFYEDGGRRVIIDEYLFIPEVVALKYGGGMLKAKHIYLSPLKCEDVPLFFEWINNRQLVLFNSPYRPVHDSQHREWFDQIQKRNDTEIFGIRLIENDELIGSCQLHNIQWIHRAAELQIRIGNERQQGKGLGMEAMKLLLYFAFHDLNLHRVNLHVFETNATAIQLYEKVGFMREGLMREAGYIDGKRVNVVSMGILLKDYKGLSDKT